MRNYSRIVVAIIAWLAIMSGLLSSGLATEIAPSRSIQPAAPASPAGSPTLSKPATKSPTIVPSVKKPAATPSRKSLQTAPRTTPKSLVLIGFCCKDGTKTSASKADCDRKRGTFFTDEKKAPSACTRFCCKDGRLQETSRGVCISEVRGKFYTDKNTALKSCRGWCCDEFKVTEASAQQCSASRGKYFGTKPEADRFCSAQKGWCCEDGKITRKSRSECSKKGEQFFTTNMAAQQSCKVQKGFCNDDGQTLRLTQAECRKRQGSYFTVQSQAVLDLTKMKQKKQKNRLAAAKERQIKQQKSIKLTDFKNVQEAPPVPPRLKPPSPPPPPPNPNANGDQFAQAELTGAVLMPNVIDLAVTDISFAMGSQETSSPRLGKSFKVIVTIKNIGIGDQTEGSPTAYFQMELTDDPYLRYHRHIVAPFTMALPPLTAGQEHTINKTITIPRSIPHDQQLLTDGVTAQPGTMAPGTYKIDAVINTSGYQPGDEINSGNNRLTKRFEVRDPQQADLAVKNLSLTPDCRVRVTLENKGASIDTEDFALAFLRVEKVQEIELHDNTVHVSEVYDQVSLNTADPNGQLKHHGGFWFLSTTFIWPNISSVSSNWSIGLESGTSATYTVTVDPYRAILDNHRVNNTKTTTLSCP